MKRVFNLIVIILSLISINTKAQIIADHTIVDRYDDIPQYYIDLVKKIWVSYAGESHSEGVRIGATNLETADPTYAVSVVESGTPESYTTANLRISRATWGDLTNSSGWVYDYGEEDWFVSSLAVERTKASLVYCDTVGPALDAFGFGWCWDGNYYAADSINKYLSATKEYINYCAENEIATKVFFTTGPVDSYTLGLGYLKSLAYKQIRDSVLEDPTRILFDYADILCYDDGSETPNTRDYDGHIYPWITETNLGDGTVAHISNAGCLRLAKAMWWMLARIAGWDGMAIDSTATDILTFTLPTQVSPAAITPSGHTVTIQVANGTNLSSLSPTITLSEGATISPTSGTPTDFSEGTIPYTVTALDGTTEQVWMITVNEAEMPGEPTYKPVVFGTQPVVHNGEPVVVYY